MRRILVRGIALFLGLFSLCNVIGNWANPVWNGNSWWIDLPNLNPSIQNTVLLIGGGLLLTYGLNPNMNRVRRAMMLAVILFFAFVALWNTWAVWKLAYQGRIELGFPVPFSLFISIALVCILVESLRKNIKHPIKHEAALVAFMAIIMALLFPLAQMFCYGRTDYRRQADVAVVLGARAYADGSPSQALYDRVRTAAELFNSGYVSRLLLSGGPGDADWHETDVMRKVALNMGVPSDCILIDREGINTNATAQNSVEQLSNIRATKILVVSHAYHLPRVKLSYQKLGLKVYTVPARESRLLSQLPRFMAREIAALWYYWWGFAKS